MSRRPLHSGRGVAVVIMLVVLLSVLAVAGPVLSASAPTTASQTLVVDDDGLQCSSATHTSITTAITNAESGDTVRVCAGTYREQVVVDKSNLKLVADGDAVITTTGVTTVRVTAPQVTLQGFTIQALQEAPYAIDVGEQDVVVRNNTIESSGVGVFLSDGRTPQGDPDPDSESATGSRVVRNSVTADGYRIWTDADGTVIRANSVTDRPGTNPQEVSTPGIVTTGNETVIQDNTVEYAPGRYDRPSENGIAAPPAIRVGMASFAQKHPPERHVSGGPTPDAHNLSRRTVVAGNSVSWASGSCIWVRKGSHETVVRDNHVSECGSGIAIFANDTVVQNNTVTDIGGDAGGDGVAIVGYDALVKNNTILRNSDGVAIGGSARVVGNTIRSGRNNGIYFSYNATFNWGHVGSGYVLNNELTDNVGSGITVPSRTVRKADMIVIHRNVIRNNGRLGIHVVNFDNTDGEWPILNATRNYWGCGGPSSGLKDPYTNRTANGTGDEVSAGDKPGFSNVHFDPFLQRSSCPMHTPTPTPTPTSSPTATASPSPTPTRTPTPPAESGGGENETGRTDGNETGRYAAIRGTGGGKTGGEGGAESGTATARSTPTAPPSPTVSPTPAVEPGFGVTTWILGVVALGLLAARRRRDTSETE